MNISLIRGLARLDILMQYLIMGGMYMCFLLGFGSPGAWIFAYLLQLALGIEHLSSGLVLGLLLKDKEQGKARLKYFAGAVCYCLFLMLLSSTFTGATDNVLGLVWLIGFFTIGSNLIGLWYHRKSVAWLKELNSEDFVEEGRLKQQIKRSDILDDEFIVE